jgi:hypothetical protein
MTLVRWQRRVGSRHLCPHDARLPTAYFLPLFAQVIVASTARCHSVM